MDPIVTTILTAPAIIALVTLAKDLGLPANLSPLIAVSLGIILAVTEQLLGANPVYQAAASGLLLGLAAAGLYDTSRLIGTSTSDA